MSASKLTVTRRLVLPFGHLWLELIQSDCGARRWSLRVSDLQADTPGPAGPPIASGPIDEEFRHDLAGLGRAVEAFIQEAAA